METNRPCIRCGKIPADGWYSKSGYCKECAEAILNAQNTASTNGVSQKDWLVTLLLAIFVGTLGVHRFYSKRIGTGILWLLTGGCLGIGWLVDIIMIATSTFKDGDGLFDEDCYFMMGDNRNRSADSRYWNNKFVPESLMQGKAIFRYFPINKMKIIKNDF